MKEIKIVSRWDSNKVLLCGQYESVKDCLVKNKNANLSGANLSRANLSRADLSGADLYGANLSRADLSGADLYGANLSRADLSRAYLYGAYLYGADLYGADLSRADLSGAKNYLSSHDFFQEIVKRQDSKTFTSKEWVCIGQIIVHRLCWSSIKKRFNKGAVGVFKKLAKVGFDEWGKHFRGLT